MRLSSLCTAAALVAVGTSALAQSSNTITNAVGARIVTPITIAKDAGSSAVDGQDLYFGRMVAPAAASTIVLYPDGTRSAASYASFNATTPRYNITAGSNLQVVSVTIGFPATVINGGNSMNITSPTFAVQGAAGAGTASGGTFTYNSTTANYFRVGGTLSIPAGQAEGLYTNNYTVVVAYN